MSKRDIPAQPAGPSAADTARINGLIAHLEDKLDRLPADAPGAQDLRDEIAALKESLELPEFDSHRVSQGLSAIRNRLDKTGEAILGEAVRDSTFFIDLGHMLGLN
ncbi:MAG TPA: hypothetical protein VGN52_07920 [Burkholderiales bacterium]|jgi:hypothetical protein